MGCRKVEGRRNYFNIRRDFGFRFFAGRRTIYDAKKFCFAVQTSETEYLNT